MAKIFHSWFLAMAYNGRDYEKFWHGKISTKCLPCQNLGERTKQSGVSEPHSLCCTMYTFSFFCDSRTAFQ